MNRKGSGGALGPQAMGVALVLGLSGLALAETGVSDQEIVFGERSAFSGPSVGLGVEVWRGHSAGFSEVNAAGGVQGRKLKLTVADDGYDAEKAAAAATKLITQDKVFALIGGVGTPTIVKALPVILKFNQTEGLFQFASFTGAQPQREPPYDKAVFNVRASYRQETKAMVDAFVAMNRRKIGIFVQDDAYGQSGRDGVTRALKDHGLQPVADTTYPRGQLFEVKNDGPVQSLKAAGVEAIIAVGAYQACAGLIRDAREAGLTVPIHNVSFVGADQMLELLRQEEKKSGRTLTHNLITTQVVPSYNDTSVPLVKEYRAAIDAYRPSAPAGLPETAYKPTGRYTFGSLEGYLDARVLRVILEKAGKDLSRKSFYTAAEGMGAFDVGLGTQLYFSRTRHQGLDKVWFTYVAQDGWKSTQNPGAMIH